MSDEAQSLPVPTFPPGEKVCGNCKLWSATVVDHRGWVGPCRLQPSRSMFPPTAPICESFAPRGMPSITPVQAPERTRRVQNVAPVIRKSGGPPAPAISLRTAAHLNQPVQLGADGELDMTRQELMEVFLEAAGYTEAQMAPKWEGGMIQILPGKKELQGKELPIDALFHKVVMVRNQLRTLEQKINSQEKLTEAEKVELQQYITRCYGSLTTFNALFRDKGDQFSGQKSDE
jgi:hypothetical protein